jgi:hypothetical protein
MPCQGREIERRIGKALRTSAFPSSMDDQTLVNALRMRLDLLARRCLRPQRIDEPVQETLCFNFLTHWHPLEVPPEGGVSGLSRRFISNHRPIRFHHRLESAGSDRSLVSGLWSLVSGFWGLRRSLARSPATRAAAPVSMASPGSGKFPQVTPLETINPARTSRAGSFATIERYYYCHAAVYTGKSHPMGLSGTVVSNHRGCFSARAGLRRFRHEPAFWRSRSDH